MSKGLIRLGAAAGAALILSAAAFYAASASSSALTQARVCGGFTPNDCLSVETCSGWLFWRSCSTKYYSWSPLGPPVCNLCS